jgi:hypothetical protein
MKKVFNYRNTVVALMVLLTTAMAPAAHATDDKNLVSAELKFIGNFRSKPVFELTFTNPGTQSDFVVNIRDEFGNSLYRESLNSSVGSKKFLLNTDEIGDDVLRFEITSKQNNKTVVYEVNQNSRFVEEVYVTRMK